MTVKNEYEAELLELAVITAENTTRAAKNLNTVRKWITFWSILALIGGIISCVAGLYSWL